MFHFAFAYVILFNANFSDYKSNKIKRKNDFLVLGNHFKGETILNPDRSFDRKGFCNG
ncbi:hypothetical protein HMPREF3218_0202282 [Prevotella bivia]|uniref:Uncharacterized protein n=1 Tax=Prevotella bivia TaxID=28125 RepID=A0A137T0T0_9BACT|nr:hypothetical protein HMPREF3202_00227 [Prevotella bivia]KXU55871.1 hypothetical protein HMPREF3218_0202282 [Prevotella bivia]